MAELLSLSFDAAARTVPATVTLAPEQDIELESVTATWNGASASGTFLACLSQYAKDGTLLSRTFPSTQFVAGDSGEVTYAPLGGVPGDDTSGIPGSDSDFVTTLLGLGPRAFWRFNDAADPPQDSTVNDYDLLSATGTVQYQVPGVAPGWLCALFNSSFRNRTGIGGATTTASVTGWINPTQIPGAAATMFQNGFGGGDGLSILLDNDGTLWPFAQGIVALTKSPVLPTGEWTHFVFTRDGGVWKWYFNGAEVVANAGTQALNPPTGVTTVGLTGGGTDLYLSHVAWFDVTLTAADVALLYAST
jgi:hypothetical protein